MRDRRARGSLTSSTNGVYSLMMGASPIDARAADCGPEIVGTAPPSDWRADRLPLRKILIFAAPAAGQGFMFNFVGMYMLAFATEKLGVAPAVMGLIFLLSRVWDAISDPIAGFLSDRTHTSIGRRRPWLIAGAIPVGVIFYLMWSPPASLAAGSLGLSLWMGATVILFYTGMTVFNMPHDALAAELTTRYEERNRVFGVRRAISGVGALGIFAVLWLLPDASDPRAFVAMVAAGVGILTALSMLGTGFFVRERLEYRGRGSESPFGVWLEVFRNPHARLLMGVFFVQQIGVGTVTTTAFFFAKYILHDERLLAVMMGGLFACSVLSIPMWIALGRHYDKKSLLNVAMWVVGGAFCALGFLREGDLVWVGIVAATAGIAIGGLDVLFPSLEADVIDYDELQSGERKEGVYFAVWHFAAKTAVGIAGMLSGALLGMAGFEPDVEQSEAARMGIRSLMSGIPLLTYGTGIFLFRRFSLTREAHAQVRRELDVRRDAELDAGRGPG